MTINMIKGTIVLLIVALFICVYIRNRKNIVYGYVEEKKRSIGVTILGWFFIISGIITIRTIILPIIYIPLGIGILRLKETARIFAVVVQGLQIVISTLAILIGLWENVNILMWINALILVNGLLAGLILYYLTRPSVKQQFRPKLTFPIKIYPRK